MNVYLDPDVVLIQTSTLLSTETNQTNRGRNSWGFVKIKATRDVLILPVQPSTKNCIALHLLRSWGFIRNCKDKIVMQI